MQKIDKKQVMMLCMAGILVFVMLSVFVRLITAKILVKRAHMNNVITQTILYGSADLQRIDNKEKGRKIEWNQLYPLMDTDVSKKQVLFTEKIQDQAAGVKKKIGEWTGKYLLGYYKLAEVGRKYEACIGWKLISPTQEIVPLDNNVWVGVVPRADVSEKAWSIFDLAQTTEASGAKFLYIQAPVVIDKYGDFGINGRFDFANQNMDDLIAKLQMYGITTIDLRNNLHEWAREDNIDYHDFFFHTDHHWRPETAVRVAKTVSERLKNYDIPVDDNNYNLQSFDIEILPDYFLGSAGKRATLSRANPDDFSVLHPRFATRIHFVVPELAIDEVGPLEVTYDNREIDSRDFYGLNPYNMYGYGDRALVEIENLLMKKNDKKILLIKDSFGDTLGPLLSLGIRNLIMLDARVFTGSIKAYIRELNPDVVILMYTHPDVDKINWETHMDKFDFR